MPKQRIEKVGNKERVRRKVYIPCNGSVNIKLIRNPNIVTGTEYIITQSLDGKRIVLEMVE